LARSQGRSLGAAVALLLGFYALALAATALLVTAALAVLLADAPGRVWIAIGCVFAALVIVRGLIPRRAPFLQPGPRLDPVRHPEFGALVRELAEATGHAPPEEVYLAHNSTVAVTEVGGALLLPGCRVLIVGLPVLDALTVDELRALLAREFGRSRGGDTRLASLFVRAYDGIARTVDDLEERGSWRRAFAAYGRPFLRRTAALRRERELQADAVGAELAGPEVAASALVAEEATADAFDGYLKTAFAPAVEGGVLPPFRAGLGRYRSVAAVRDETECHVRAALAARTEPRDTRPSLGERIVALGAAPPSAAPRPAGGARSAAELVRGLDLLEEDLMHHVLAERELSVRRAGWEEVPSSVLVPAWRLTAGDSRALLAGVTAATLPEALTRHPHAAGVLASGLALVLYDAGWTLTAAPGETVSLAHAGHAVEPFELTARLVAGDLDAAGWTELMEGAEIAAVQLGGGASGEPRAAALAR
jgi:Zn-dependent protease with chaperone function